MLTRLLNTIGLFTKAQYEYQVALCNEADHLNEVHIEREQELRSELSKADLLAMKYKTMFNDAETAINIEKNKRFEIEKERLSLADANDKMKSHISTVEKKLQDAVRSHNTAALRVNSLEKEIESLNATIDENTIKISDLTHSCEEYIKTINGLNEEKMNLIDEIGDANGDASKLRDELDKIYKSYEELLKKHAHAEFELQELRKPAKEKGKPKAKPSPKHTPANTGEQK